MSVARHLTAQDRQQIVSILDGWPADSKLPWDRLLDRIGHHLGIAPTRQTLSRDPRIKLAFQNREGGKPHPVRQSATEKRLGRRSSASTPKTLGSRRKRRSSRRCSTRWQYNAHKHGFTEEMLG